MLQPIPDITRCMELMEEVAMWENIRRHSFMVARVAERIQRGLVAHGRAENPPNRDLVIAGALLHDIAKTKCLKEQCRHAEVGAIFCITKGYSHIAEIVANHVILEDYSTNRYTTNLFNAKEIVFYADKRVRHDEVVSLDDRLEYILNKYGNNGPEQDALIVQNFNKCRRLEEYLFRCLDFSPEDILGEISVIPKKLDFYPPNISQHLSGATGKGST